MEPDFWLERWREGQTGFHQTRVTPLLAKYWPALNLPKNANVLVPLCGKTLDMRWLAEQGHQVTGVELSTVAIEQFFNENGLSPRVTQQPYGTEYTWENLRIICGDIFNLDAAMLATFTGVYDRAALVALPPEMRKRYVAHVYGQLAPGYKGLLITLDYDQSRMQGPPFSVGNNQVQEIYSSHSEARLIDRRDIIEKEPKFKEKGLNQLDTLVFELTGHQTRTA
jgi:thiopurine S-methyltransferase